MNPTTDCTAEASVVTAPTAPSTADLPHSWPSGEVRNSTTLLMCGSRASPNSIANTSTLAFSLATFAAVVSPTRSNSFCTEVADAALSPMMANDWPSRSVAVAAAPMLPMLSLPNNSMRTGNFLSSASPPIALTTSLICFSARTLSPEVNSLATALAERPSSWKAWSCFLVAASPAPRRAMKVRTPVAATSALDPVLMRTALSAAPVSPEMFAPLSTPALRCTASATSDALVPNWLPSSLMPPKRDFVSAVVNCNPLEISAKVLPASLPVMSHATPILVTSEVSATRSTFVPSMPSDTSENAGASCAVRAATSVGSTPSSFAAVLMPAVMRSKPSFVSSAPRETFEMLISSVSNLIALSVAPTIPAARLWKAVETPPEMRLPAATCRAPNLSRSLPAFLTASRRPPSTSRSSLRAFWSATLACPVATERPCMRALRVPDASPFLTVSARRSAISLRLRATCAARSATAALARSDLVARGPSAAVASRMALAPSASPDCLAMLLLAPEMALSRSSGPLRLAPPPPPRNPPPLPAPPADRTCATPDDTRASAAATRSALRSMDVAACATTLSTV